MAFFTTSPELEEITLPQEISYVNTLTIDEITNDDIVLTTGTLQDEFLIQSIFSRGIIPYFFMLKREQDSTMNSIVQSISLTLNVNSLEIDKSLLDRCQNIVSSAEKFYKALETYNENEQEIEEMQTLIAAYLYLDNTHRAKWARTRASCTPDYAYSIQSKTTKNSNDLYLILSKEQNNNNHKIKIFKVTKETKEQLEEIVKKHFETIYDGNYNLNSATIKCGFTDITINEKKTFLLFDKDLKPQLCTSLDTTENSLELSISAKDLKVYRLINNNSLSPTTVETMQNGLLALKEILENNTTTQYEHEHILNFIKFNKYAKPIYFNSSYSKNSKHTYSNENDHKVADILQEFIEKLNKKKKNIDVNNLTMINFSLSLIKNIPKEDLKNLNDNIIFTCFKDIDAGINIGRIARNRYTDTTEAEYKTFEKYIEQVKTCIKEKSCDDYLQENFKKKVPKDEVKDLEYLNALKDSLSNCPNCKKKCKKKNINNIDKIINWLTKITSFNISEEEYKQICKYDNELESDESSDLKRKILELSFFIYKTLGKSKINTETDIKNSFLKFILLLFGKNSIKDKSQYLCYFFFINKYHKEPKVKYELYLQLQSYVNNLFSCIDNEYIYPINRFLQNNNLHFSCTEKDNKLTLSVEINLPHYQHTKTICKKKQKITDRSRKYTTPRLTCVNDFASLIYMYDKEGKQLSTACNKDNEKKIINNFVKIYTHYNRDINCQDDITLFLKGYNLTTTFFNQKIDYQTRFKDALQALHEKKYSYNDISSLINCYEGKLYEKDIRLCNLYKELASLSPSDEEKRKYITRALKIASFAYPEGHQLRIEIYQLASDQRKMNENIKILLTYYIFLSLANEKQPRNLQTINCKGFFKNYFDINTYPSDLLANIYIDIERYKLEIDEKNVTEFNSTCYNYVRLLTTEIDNCKDYIAEAETYRNELERLLNVHPVNVNSNQYKELIKKYLS
jgi:hypothetical protein